MTLDVSDAHGFVYEPTRGEKRRVKFVPRSDGTWLRIESEWNGCRWRETGREVVETVRRV